MFGYFTHPQSALNKIMCGTALLFWDPPRTTPKTRPVLQPWNLVMCWSEAGSHKYSTHSLLPEGQTQMPQHEQQPFFKTWRTSRSLKINSYWQTNCCTTGSACPILKNNVHEQDFFFFCLIALWVLSKYLNLFT